MATSVIFPDSEKVLVKALKVLLEASGEPLESFRVGTYKLPAGQSSPAQQVVLRSDGGTVFDRALKEESMAINIWTKNSNENIAYSEANRLALKLEALLPLVKNTTFDVLSVDEINITPIVEEGEEQLRYIQFVVVLKGSTFSLNLN